MTNTNQKKSIQKTVLIIVAIMVTILTLFIHKITTPRYLSDIELKINGLELIKPTTTINVSTEKWMLVVNNQAERLMFEAFYTLLKPQVQKQLSIVESTFLELGDNHQAGIAIIKPSGEYLAYLKPPYEKNKVLLTLSSVITHR